MNSQTSRHDIRRQLRSTRGSGTSCLPPAPSNSLIKYLLFSCNKITEAEIVSPTASIRNYKIRVKVTARGGGYRRFLSARARWRPGVILFSSLYLLHELFVLHPSHILCTRHTAAHLPLISVQGSEHVAVNML